MAFNRPYFLDHIIVEANLSLHSLLLTVKEEALPLVKQRNIWALPGGINAN